MTRAPPVETGGALEHFGRAPRDGLVVTRGVAA